MGDEVEAPLGFQDKNDVGSIPGMLQEGDLNC